MDTETLIKYHEHENEKIAVKGTDKDKVAKSRWFSFEFITYYFVIIYATVFAVTETVRISSPTHSAYSTYSHLLQNGWIFNRKIDLSDHQFRSFRDGIPSLTAIFTIMAVINRRFGNKSRFYGTAVFLFLMHGFKAIEPVSLILLNYITIKILSRHPSTRSLILPFTWIFSIICLFTFNSTLFNNTTKWFIWSGFLSGWNVIFKISILRLISFNLEYLKSLKDEDYSSLSFPSVFTFKSYFSYTFYPPLYLSGPIMSFTDFHTQTHKEKEKSFKDSTTASAATTATTTSTTAPSNWLFYGLRLLFSMLTLEIILHFFYVCAIKTSNAWNADFTPLAYSAVAFFNLKIIWLKLLIIWRFSRFFALIDGIDPPENMIRCMSNNYSMSMFWRSWHRSFNLWTLKYLYIPLGGRTTANWNIFPIFAFVAIWHDINWQMLIWGCFIPLIILPEISTKWLAKRLSLHKMSSYRQICAAGAALNIFLMMLGNLIGFSVGLEGARLMLKQIVGGGGVIFTGFVLIVFYSAAHLMFELREEEFRKSEKYSNM